LSQQKRQSAPARTTSWTPVWLVAAAAIVMGLPTVRGDFVGSDDHRLVLNHVLVSRPSLSHAVELFTIPHRDLYQPLPLLSFSLEFAVVRALALDVRGAEGVAWLFHLDNVLLHALNAVLVWFVVRRLHRLVGSYQRARAAEPGDYDERSAGSTATVAALLFAVHPIHAEVVAWVNGRMMLLSTLFALLTVLAVSRSTAFCDVPETDRRARWYVSALGAITSAVLCGLSKVRVGLVVLAALPIVLARRLRSSRMLWLWSAVVVVTAVFAWINISTTADAEMFSGGARSLKGPRVVRVCLALSHYFTHFAWPAGLCSYYPTPPLVRWTDGRSLVAVAVTVFVLGGWLASAWRSMPARLGIIWFLGTLASTLPIVPARNVLAADRYLYLPIIGLLWPLAHGLVLMARRVSAAGDAHRKLTAGLAGVLFASYVGTSWYVGSFYATALAKTERIAMVSPDTPRVWTRAGWLYHEAGNYERALEYARRDLAFENADVQSAARELIGACKIEQGEVAEGIADLEAAVELAPENVKAMERIGRTLEKSGRVEEAVPWYERAVETAPRYNPPKIKLARIYTESGRREAARQLYQQVLEANAFDVDALIELSRLDIEESGPTSLRRAIRRLRKLLTIMPDHTDARVNLAAALHAAGETDEAISIYRQVLRRTPDHSTAALNLAMILEARGDSDEAARLLASARRGEVRSLQEAIGMFDLHVRHGRFDEAVAVWSALPDSMQRAPQVLAWSSWARATAGQHARALELASRHEKTAGEAPLPLAARALVGLQRRRPDEATWAVVALAEMGDRARDARRRLLNALQRHDLEQPGDPWTICLAARVLIADDQLDAGRAFTDLCAEQCQGPACEAWVGSLIQALADNP